MSHQLLQSAVGASVFLRSVLEEELNKLLRAEFGSLRAHSQRNDAHYFAKQESISHSWSPSSSPSPSSSSTSPSPSSSPWTLESSSSSSSSSSNLPERCFFVYNLCNELFQQLDLPTAHSLRFTQFIPFLRQLLTSYQLELEQLQQQHQTAASTLTTTTAPASSSTIRVLNQLSSSTTTSISNPSATFGNTVIVSRVKGNANANENAKVRKLVTRGKINFVRSILNAWQSAQVSGSVDRRSSLPRSLLHMFLLHLACLHTSPRLCALRFVQPQLTHLFHLLHHSIQQQQQQHGMGTKKKKKKMGGRRNEGGKSESRWPVEVFEEEEDAVYTAYFEAERASRDRRLRRHRQPHTNITNTNTNKHSDVTAHTSGSDGHTNPIVSMQDHAAVPLSQTNTTSSSSSSSSSSSFGLLSSSSSINSSSLFSSSSTSVLPVSPLPLHARNSSSSFSFSVEAAATTTSTRVTATETAGSPWSTQRSTPHFYHHHHDDSHRHGDDGSRPSSSQALSTSSNKVATAKKGQPHRSRRRWHDYEEGSTGMDDEAKQHDAPCHRRGSVTGDRSTMLKSNSSSNTSSCSLPRSLSSSTSSSSSSSSSLSYHRCRWTDFYEVPNKCRPNEKRRPETDWTKLRQFANAFK